MSNLGLYIESLSMYSIILIILFFLNLKYWRPKYINPLSILYYIFITTILLDICWSLIDGKKDFYVLNIIINSIYHFENAWIGWTYICHVDSITGNRIKKNKKIYYSLLILPIISSIIALTSQKTSLLFYINQECKYCRGELFFYENIIINLYLLIGSLIALERYFKAELISEKHKLLVHAFFIAPAFILSLIQSFVPPTVAALYPGIVISSLILYAVMQEERITRDTLTKLPNRFTIDKQMIDCIHRQQKGSINELWLVIGDLDKFKQINDNFGHTTGDRALQIAADVLYFLCKEFDCFAGRLGGDEFVILSESKNDTNIKKLLHKLPFDLSQASQDESFTLAMSCGLAKYEDNLTVKQFIDRADNQLYVYKKLNNITR